MRPVIGVMGASAASTEEIEMAYELGKSIAKENWVTLNGGYKGGVMGAVSRGAKDAGGLVIGILNGTDKSNASEYLDVAVVTGIGNARNNINVLSSDVVVACGHLSTGTLSEVALATSAKKPVIIVGEGDTLQSQLRKLAPDQIYIVTDPNEAIAKIKEII